MKHSPLALIEDGLPVVVIAPKDKYFEKTLSNMQEVIARGGKVLLITNSGGKVISENIRFQIDLPDWDLTLTPFLFTIPGISTTRFSGKPLIYSLFGILTAASS